jgi:hypothetical protein
MYLGPFTEVQVEDALRQEINVYKRMDGLWNELIPSTDYSVTIELI